MKSAVCVLACACVCTQEQDFPSTCFSDLSGSRCITSSYHLPSNMIFLQGKKGTDQNMGRGQPIRRRTSRTTTTVVRYFPVARTTRCFPPQWVHLSQVQLYCSGSKSKLFMSNFCCPLLKSYWNFNCVSHLLTAYPARYHLWCYLGTQRNVT